jgi:hypothetical protein
MMRTLNKCTSRRIRQGLNYGSPTRSDCRRRKQTSTRQQETTGGLQPLCAASSHRADNVFSPVQSTVQLQSGLSALAATSTRQSDGVITISGSEVDGVAPIAAAAASRGNEDDDNGGVLVSALHANAVSFIPTALASMTYGSGAGASALSAQSSAVNNKTA